MIRTPIAALVIVGLSVCSGQTLLTLPTLVGARGDTVTMPVTISDVTALGVLSFEFTVTYDHSVLSAFDVAADGTLSEQTGWSVLSNDGGTALKVAGFGAEPLSGGGVLLNLTWVIIGNPGASTAVAFASALLNAGNPPVTPINGSFQVAAVSLSAPVLMAPANNSMIQSLVTDLEWVPVDGAESYRVQVAPDSTFTPVILDDSSTIGTSLAVGPLQPAAKYYWRVRGKNSAGQSPWSDAWAFQANTTTLATYDPIPQQFELRQNYPNPWNPSTVIGYNVAHRSLVEITVYSALGQAVVSLVNQIQDPGFYEVPLQSDRLASGVYLYRMTTSEFAQTRMMVHVK